MPLLSLTRGWGRGGEQLNEEECIETNLIIEKFFALQLVPFPENHSR
ncbi:hypothetical protein ACNFNZ_05155 [Empedobacter brevis]